MCRLEPFYRGEDTNADGTGLGLPIAKEIAILHAGKLTVANNANRSGLVVTIEIPVAQKSVGTRQDATA